ncbi:uncharacterized protein LOC119323940 [Triticum dicoccoides]|uniref:uncharacterized protein LOC119323940 n=1 Tax=Triticum dicoccoides TaxID=85692 RepID=UPI000E7CE632|nr:uncharacterized protein LOC119323940 [Triticum dicoccoides]
MEDNGGGAVAAGSSGTAAGSSSAGTRSCLTEDEYQKLVNAVRPWFRSVVRIIQTRGTKKKKEAIYTSNALVVLSRAERSFFVTCNHNLGRNPKDATIRLYNGTKDYPIDMIHYRDSDLDLLLFLVKNVPVLQELPMFCPKSEEPSRFDLVAVLGFSCPKVQVDQPLEDLVLVKEPTILPGEIVDEPFHETKYKLNLINSCSTTAGISGSPLFNEMGKVVGIHLATDKTMREAASADTLLVRLKRWLRDGEDSNTIEQLVEKVYEKFSHGGKSKR